METTFGVGVEDRQPTFLSPISFPRSGGVDRSHNFAGTRARAHTFASSIASSK
jgi:hypothetical protein